LSKLISAKNGMLGGSYPRLVSMTLHVHDPFFNIDTFEAFAYYTE